MPTVQSCWEPPTLLSRNFKVPEPNAFQEPSASAGHQVIDFDLGWSGLGIGLLNVRQLLGLASVG